MKQLKMLIALVAMLHTTMAFAIIATPLSVAQQNSATHSELTMLITDYGKMTVQDFLALNADKVRTLTGKKMSLKDKLGLWWVQKQINKHQKEFTQGDVDTGAFKINWGAFVLGLLLGLIGLIITLFFKDKKAWVSALIGWGIFLAFFLLLTTLAKT